MTKDLLSNKIDELSVVARQCIAAICFERYCEYHLLKSPDTDAFIEHLWKITEITEPSMFVVWEEGFQSLTAANRGKPLSEEFLLKIPANIHQEYIKTGGKCY